MSEKILVLGATGNVGRPLVETLIARGEQVKAASRKGHDLGAAEGVVFDFHQQDTIERALQNVKSVYVLAPGGQLDAVGLLTPIIQQAAKRHIKVVLQTAIGVDADDQIPFRQVELALERSGTPFVILRPNWFTDNFNTYWANDITRGLIQLPAGDGKTSFVTARDIAESAAAALTQSTFDGKTFVLTGPEALSYSEAAGLLSRVQNTQIRYRDIDDETFIGNLVQAGTPESYAKFLAMIFYPVRHGETAAITNAVKTLTGHEPRSLSVYLQKSFLQENTLQATAR